jgi:excisionase family DNA binding protein
VSVENGSLPAPATPVYTTGRVAKICNVAPRTVSKWFDSGRLKGYRIPGSQDRRIPRAQLVKFLRENGMPLDGVSVEAVGAYLPAGYGGLEVVDPFDVGARASAGTLAVVVVGCGGGLDAAVYLARRVKETCGAAAVALVLGCDRPESDVPPGVFDRVFPADAPPADVAAWAEG